MHRKIDWKRFIPLLPAVFFIVVYLLPLGSRVMIRPDEFRYAEIPREMIGSGKWMNPRLDGVKYFEKPTLGYQLIAASMKIFGENKFAVRLPSALGTLLAAAVVWLLFWRETKERFWASAAAGTYLASALVIGVGTFAVLDAPFAGAVTVSIGAVYLACRSKRSMECVLWLVAAGLAAAVAFMLKGFLAFALPCIVAAPFLIWNREWKKLFVFPWLPLAIALLIAVPWALIQHRAEPDFWRYFFVEEHLKRFTSGTYDRKAQPFWYFIPVLLGGIMPVGSLWIAGALGCTKEWFKRPFTRFMICWFAFPFLFFSASSCKLGTYILPCFPPLALLLVSALKNAWGSEKFRTRCRGIYTVVGIVLMTAAVAGALALTILPFLPAKLTAKVPFPLTLWLNWWSILTLAALAVCGAALCRLRDRRGAALWVFLAGAAPAICFGMLAIPEAGLGERTPEAGLRACFKCMPDHAECTIAVERSCIAPVCWTLKRSDVVVAGNKLGELKFGIENYPDEYKSKHISEEDFPAWIKGRKVLYVTFYDLKKRPLPKSWPQPTVILETGGVTVMRFE